MEDDDWGKSSRVEFEGVRLHTGDEEEGGSVVDCGSWHPDVFRKCRRLQGVSSAL